MRKNNRMFTKSLIASALSVFIIAGCTTIPVDNAAKQVKNDSHIASQKLRQSTVMTAQPVTSEVIDDYFISSKPFELTNQDLLPDNFNEIVTYSKPNPVSLQEVITSLGSELKVKTLFTSDAIDYLSELSDKVQEDSTKSSAADNINTFEIVDRSGEGLVGSKIKFTLSYQGSAREFLDYVSAKTNLFWKWENETLTFFRTETETFIVDYLGGQSSFSANVNSSLEDQGSSDSGGGTKNSSSHDTSISYEPESVWTSVQNAVISLLSDTGKVAVSHESGTVTVTDTPRNIEKVASYLSQLNDIIGQQIAIKTEIYEIQLDERANKGIDLNAIYSGSKDFSLNLASSFADKLAPNLQMGVLDPTSNFTGSQGFIDALNSVANVSFVTTSIVNTTNGMPAPLQMLDTTGYLKNVSRERDEDGNRETTNIDQGYAKSGFSLSFLPRVTSDGDVNVMFAGDLTQLTNMKERKFDGTTIEFPENSNKSFLQRFIVKSGQSILVAGFERMENSERVESLGNKDTWMAGGKKSGGQKRVMTLIMLTPYLMDRD
jgi:type IVB pilus formation R64 PilN family outer membrane protein